MKETYNRRHFLRSAATFGLTVGLEGSASDLFAKAHADEVSVGIIGLDTSHSIEILKALNSADKTAEFKGFRVTAAYPKGSSDIKSSAERIPQYTSEAQKYGAKITGSVAELLTQVDVVFLETNDGRLHLSQAMEVIKAGKPIFVDKPAAASLEDVIRIYEAAERYKVPIFSSSSLRYINDAEAMGKGELIGKVIGADVYSPATLEKTHPDLFWYGIHGVEMLFTVMGTGCKSVVRVHSQDADVVIGTWSDGRLGVFRGTRSGKHAYGGLVFGEKAVRPFGDFKGSLPLIAKVLQFFKDKTAPVPAAETIEIYAFMAAADESKRNNGQPVELEKVIKKAKKN